MGIGDFYSAFCKKGEKQLFNCLENDLQRIKKQAEPQEISPRQLSPCMIWIFGVIGYNMF